MAQQRGQFDRTTTEFLAHLRALDITLTVDGDQLRCHAPRGVLTGALRMEMAARKAEILDLMRSLSRKAPGTNDRPLSFAQQRLWFLDQLEPGTPAYALAVRKRLHGVLDVAALEHALAEVLRRHEALRTTFESRQGHPIQHVDEPTPFRLPIVSLEVADPAERARAAAELVRAETRRPFDLARGPVLRAVVLRLGPEEHELVVSVHHIVADGWSLVILDREISTLYEAFAAGRSSPLPELPIQYADFAAWQHRTLTGDVLEAQRRYWREHFADRPDPLQLPTDHPRPRHPTNAAATYGVVMPRALCEGLRALSRQQGATLFMTLLAAFKALLSRYTGQEDVVVGVPLANRQHLELEPLIGLFANTLPLRTRLTGDPTFWEALARVRETCVAAYTYPDMPFEKLMEDLHPVRLPGRNPLFEITFVFQHAVADGNTFFVTPASAFDLTLFVLDGHDGTVSVTAQYKRDLFEPETIARLIRHYVTLLEGTVADPACRLSALPILEDAEARWLLVECNATTRAYPRDRAVPACFEDQVDVTPEAVALAFAGGSLTYANLDRLANRLAHHLRALGVGPERVVGVWMDRSPDMIVAMLAIAKAGGTYAALDRLATDTRLAAMLRSGRIDLVVTQANLASRFTTLGVRTVTVDADADMIARQPQARPGVRVSADGTATVMYTSGSTGEPNGVAVTHRGIVRLVKGTDYASFGPDEVVLHLSAPSFDASSFEIWGALLNGGQLVIPPPGAVSIADLGTLLAQYRVTTLWLTAGLFQQVVDHRVEDLRGLRQLLAGGDVLSPSHVARVRATLPALRLVNGYGPTEGTTFTCCHEIATPPSPGRSVPIGRPIANTRVYVLDRDQRPVPVGVPGELYIAGDGLASGYVGRPDLTAERFIVTRLTPTLQERLYRSGDLVRWLADGTLEFLGRLDDQVKVRGYRVELGEIETTLARHPHVRACVVALRGTGSEPRLVAYVVGEAASDPRALREFVARTLPEYMVPSVYVAIDRLPFNVNGKVNRNALPEPDPQWVRTSAPFEPRDELERRLAHIWRDVLRVARPGTLDNFFDLGGHSLLAVQMFARLETELGVNLPLATLFEAPTIAGLAALIRDTARSPAGRSLVAIQPLGSRPPVFGLPGVEGGVLSYHALVRLLGPDQPFYGLQSRGLDGHSEPLMRIEDIAAVCVQEICDLYPAGPCHLIGMCMGGVVAWEVAQQLRAEGRDVGLLVLVETWPPPSSARRRGLAPGHTAAAVEYLITRLRRYGETLARTRGRTRLRHLRGALQPLLDLARHRDPFRGIRSDFHRHAVRRANLFAFERYEPRPYPGPVVLMYAEGRHLPDVRDERLRWGSLARDFHAAGVPGADSGELLREPHVRVVAAQLAVFLRRAQPSTPAEHP